MNCESGLYTKQAKYINLSKYKFIKSVQLVKKVRDNLPKGWVFQIILASGQGRMGTRRSGKAELKEPGENIISEMANREKSSSSTPESMIDKKV